MFTGIIEEIGTVRAAQLGEQGGSLAIAARTVLGGVRQGESIAVDGCCLTVVRFDAESFTVEVSPETVARTTLKRLRVGGRVNLERALRVGDRMGGHYVNGHVDGVGRIADISRAGNSHTVTITAPSELMRYIVEKGSVAVDGISLTGAGLARESFSIAVIPATEVLTTLIEKGTGAAVNLECDIIGKYVERFLGLDDQAGAGHPRGAGREPITRAFLAKHGFAD
ncbi:MAG: riboflavin synthase [Candidatus Tectomicrobia bacterium]|nr:riboflavin synthase [Candidatus Tectomicrobia bacterium]